LRPSAAQQEHSVSEHKRTRLAFIGFGEVGQRFSGDLMRGGGVSISAYDIVFDDARQRAARLAKVEALSVQAKPTAAEAASGADIVVSAVTADQAETVARQAATFMKPGQVLLDVNSASPSTKKRAAAVVEPTGVHYVEGAVMAAVADPGIRVQILAGGPAAADTARRLNALGMNLTPVSTEHGRASAMKLCRSIMIKGIEALIADCRASSAHWDVENEVYASLAATFPGTDWRKMAEYMGERIETHGLRRAAEMREAAEMLADMGRDAGLARAVADAQQRGAKRKA
jgi:3-hydroxyisobutyrate dehydrogenase-like beta-hydroxyacid dehydrogenase